MFWKSQGILFSERKTLPLVLLWNISERKAFVLHCESDVIPKAFQTFQKIVRKTCYSSQFDLRIFLMGAVYLNHSWSCVLFCFILSLRYTWLGFTAEFIKRNIKQRLCWDVKVKVFFKSMNQFTLIFNLFLWDSWLYVNESYEWKKCRRKKAPEIFSASSTCICACTYTHTHKYMFVYPSSYIIKV